MKIVESVKAVIDRFEGNLAVVSFDLESSSKNQTLVIPKKNLPLGIKEGDVLAVEFQTESAAKEEKDRIARKLLEDILNGK